MDNKKNDHNGRELLNVAFGDISLDLISEAECPPARKRVFVRLIAVAAVCLATVAVTLPFVIKIKETPSPIEPSVGEHEHAFDERGEEVAPTCVEDGYTVYRCVFEGCDNEERRDLIPAKGHGELSPVTVEGGCLTLGYSAERCSDCGTDINKRDFTAARVHYLQKNGEEYTCSLCGSIFSESDALLTHSRRLEDIRSSGKSVLVNADLNELTLGAIVNSYVDLDDNRFTMHVSGAGCVHSEIRKDSAVGDSYLRHTVRSGGWTENVANVGGSCGDTVTVEFTVRLGERDRNGDLVDWTAYWQARYASAEDTVAAASMDRNGVLSFANSQFSVRLSDKHFSHIRLIYRFSENSYDIYVDGKLCDSGVRIVEGDDDATAKYKPRYFIYASTNLSADQYNASFDLGGFIAYKE